MFSIGLCFENVLFYINSKLKKNDKTISLGKTTFEAKFCKVTLVLNQLEVNYWFLRNTTPLVG